MRPFLYLIIKTMIKARTLNTAEVLERPRALIDPTAHSVLRLVYAPDTLRNAIQTVTNNNEYATRTKEQIARLYGNLTQTMRNARESERALEAHDWTAENERAQTELEKIARLAYIEKIDARGDTLLIQTRLLFTNIQRGYNEKQTDRTCIGAFTIKIEPTNRVQVHNALFPSMRNPHWSISNSYSPCWGDWGTEVSTHLRARDYYSFLTLLYPYLISTLDGSAYMRSYQWKNERQTSLNARRVTAGKYVIAHSNVTTNYSYDEETDSHDIENCIPRGMKGIVLESGRGWCKVEWNDTVSDPEGDDGDGFNGNVWSLEKGLVTPITKAQYDSSTFTIENVTFGNFTVLDTLPDNATLSDGKRALGIK